MDRDTDIIDVVGNEPEGAQPGGGRRRLIARPMAAVIVIVLVLVAAIGYGLDAWQRNREVDVLFRTMVDGQRAVRSAEGQVRAMVQYAGPTVYRAGLSTELRDDLDELLTTAAARGAVFIEAARRGAADVEVVPWHNRVQVARHAYLAYLDATLAYYRSGAADPAALFTTPPGMGLQLDTALVAFQEAAPKVKYRQLLAALSGPDGAG